MCLIFFTYFFSVFACSIFMFSSGSTVSSETGCSQRSIRLLSLLSSVNYSHLICILLGRVCVFTTEIAIMFRSEKPDESMELWFDKNDLYQFLSTLPSFTYVIMGNIMFLFIVELFALKERSQRGRRQKLVNLATVLVVVEIVIVLGLFFGAIIIKQLHKDSSRDDIQSLRIK